MKVEQLTLEDLQGIALVLEDRINSPDLADEPELEPALEQVLVKVRQIIRNVEGQR